MFKYYFFFHSNKSNKHIASPIGYDCNSGVSLESAISISGIKKNFFLKVDIEGWEYRILDQIIENSHLMTGIAIEFHDTDIHFPLIENFVNNVSANMYLGSGLIN